MACQPRDERTRTGFLRLGDPHGALAAQQREASRQAERWIDEQIREHLLQRYPETP